MAIDYSRLASSHWPSDHWFHGINLSRAERIIEERAFQRHLDGLRRQMSGLIAARKRHYTSAEYIRALNWGSRHSIGCVYRSEKQARDAKLAAVVQFTLGCL